MSKRKKEVEFTIEDMHKSDYESRPFRVTTDYNEDTQRIVLDYAQKYNGVQSGNSFAFN